MIFKAIASGAKGSLDEAASPTQFVQAIRIVNQGSVWAPRHVLSMFIERASPVPARSLPARRAIFTAREKEVLELLVAGRSTKEIGSPLGIGERTVKAHVAKLMRKVGVQNPYRALSSRSYTLASYRKIELEDIADLDVWYVGTRERLANKGVAKIATPCD